MQDEISAPPTLALLAAMVSSLIDELDATMAQNASLIAINRRLLATNRELLDALGKEKP